MNQVESLTALPVNAGSSSSCDLILLAGLFHTRKDRHAHASSRVTYGILAGSLIILSEKFDAVRIKEARDIERAC